ncbi:MFS transporter [Micromonospora sp. NPDC047074]|uniref:MFS transporter n=1 Tax=Micromonospora sp. NPDC047074 TaxID=3154339 RepID=UPI0033F29680
MPTTPRTADDSPLAPAPAAPARPARPGGVLARYTTAAVAVRLTDEGARVAMVLLALERTGSTAYGGLLVAALMVPHVVAAPLVGAAADRVRRRRLFYIGSLTGYAAALAGAAVLVETSRLLTVALVIVAGCFAPLLIGGLTSLLSELAPDRLKRAYGLDSASYSLAGIAGPALAAVLAGLVGATTTLILLAGVVLLGCVTLWTLPLRTRPPGSREGGHAPVLAAVPVLWRRRALGAVTLGTSLGQLGIGAMPVIAALLARHYGDASLTGVFMSTAAVGGLVGSLVYARYPLRGPQPERVVVVALLATAVPFALVPLMPSMWLTLPLFLLVGLINAPLFCGLLEVREREAPRDVHTQVFALGAGLKSTAAAAGAALAGVLTGWGTGALLFGVAACHLLGALTGEAVLRRADSPVSTSPLEKMS